MSASVMPPGGASPPPLLASCGCSLFVFCKHYVVIEMYVIEEEENKEKSCIRMKEIIVNYQKKE
jgi:hypothetical protein